MQSKNMQKNETYSNEKITNHNIRKHEQILIFLGINPQQQKHMQSKPCNENHAKKNRTNDNMDSTNPQKNKQIVYLLSESWLLPAVDRQNGRSDWNLKLCANCWALVCQKKAF